MYADELIKNLGLFPRKWKRKVIPSITVFSIDRNFHLIDFHGVSAQKGNVNPSAMMASLLSRRAKLHEELRSIEKQAILFLIPLILFWLPKKRQKTVVYIGILVLNPNQKDNEDFGVGNSANILHLDRFMTWRLVIYRIKDSVAMY